MGAPCVAVLGLNYAQRVSGQADWGCCRLAGGTESGPMALMPGARTRQKRHVVQVHRFPAGLQALAQRRRRRRISRPSWRLKPVAKLTASVAVHCRGMALRLSPPTTEHSRAPGTAANTESATAAAMRSALPTRGAAVTRVPSPASPAAAAGLCCRVQSSTRASHQTRDTIPSPTEQA